MTSFFSASGKAIVLVINVSLLAWWRNGLKLVQLQRQSSFEFPALLASNSKEVTHSAWTWFTHGNKWYFTRSGCTREWLLPPAPAVEVIESVPCFRVSVFRLSVSLSFDVTEWHQITTVWQKRLWHIRGRCVNAAAFSLFMWQGGMVNFAGARNMDGGCLRNFLNFAQFRPGTPHPPPIINDWSLSWESTVLIQMTFNFTFMLPSAFELRALNDKEVTVKFVS